MSDDLMKTFFNFLNKCNKMLVGYFFLAAVYLQEYLVDLTELQFSMILYYLPFFIYISCSLAGLQLSTKVLDFLLKYINLRFSKFKGFIV